MQTKRENLAAIVNKAVKAEEFMLVLATLRALVKRLPFEEYIF